jgi:hypothetical protein
LLERKELGQNGLILGQITDLVLARVIDTVAVVAHHRITLFLN